MTIKLGMTGNRNGITDQAMTKLKEFIQNNDISEAHHGDCIGADTDFHNICVSNNIKIVIHPPNNASQRSFCKSDTIKPEKPYIVRNHNIVDNTDILIAFPATKFEVLRSGTWSTIRYAKKKNRKILLVYSDGQIKKINH